MTLKLGMQHWVLKFYQVCSNDDPGLPLAYFTTRSDLDPYAFVWEKGLIDYFISSSWESISKVHVHDITNEQNNIYRNTNKDD